jgi:solute:Na+ symporter, SSS family
MELTGFDIGTFVAFLVLVVGVSLYVSRREKSSEDYFLAGRRLTWWLIGFSLIASNISTEHFVGMAGQAFGRVGLAIASYEWMSAITLVIVAWWLLPKFLKVGIYTMPEFLEYRFDSGTRTIMATYLMMAYVIVFLATVLYSGAQGLNGVFDFPEILHNRCNMTMEDATFWATVAGIWSIGLIAAAYTIYGGLKAVVWSDLIQGAALIAGGGIVLYLGLKLTGGGSLVEGGGVTGGSVVDGWTKFSETNADKLHVVLPWNDKDVPWLAVFIGGLWIPNIFYWGLNQFITQRTLGAKNLTEGQRGIFLACFFKLLIPFIIVIPGIMAFQMFGDAIMAKTADNIDKAGEIAYPYMITQIMPPFLRGIMLAALAGAVMSSFNSGLNSAATIYTVDIYGKFIRKNASPERQVRVGRIATAIIVVLACLWAPMILGFEGVFRYIQEVWGFISPGIVAAFLVGLIFKRVPAIAAKGALLLGPVLYAISRIPGWIMEKHYEWQTAADGSETLFKLVRDYDTGEAVATTAAGAFTTVVYTYSTMAFLHHMGIIFLVLAGFMLVVAKLRPLEKPVTYPQSKVDTTVKPSTYVIGTAIVIATIALYVIFW